MQLKNKISLIPEKWNAAAFIHGWEK